MYSYLAAVVKYGSDTSALTGVLASGSMAMTMAMLSSTLKILFFKMFPPFCFVRSGSSKYPVREVYRILSQSLRTYRTNKSVQWLKCFSFPKSKDKW